jgi:large subunit ribosomal protein L14
MKAIASKPVKSLSVGSYMVCADNSGAKELQIIAVKKFKGRRRTKPRAGIADLVVCRVSKGNEKVRHELFKAVIIRARKEWSRASGVRISFEDNAAVIVDDKFVPKGTLIKGPVAKEAVDRFSTIGKVSNLVV